MIRPIAILAALLFLATPGRTGEPDPEATDAVVFLKDLGRGKPAPAKKALDDLVILTGVGKRDPYYRVVEILTKGGAKEIIEFRPDRLADAFARLAKRRPGNVVVVIRPETLDVHFQYEFLERASRLDGDPFVDFRFGYVTGATADEAVAFVEGIAKARKKRLPRTILMFGPSSRPAPLSAARPHHWAEGFTVRRYHHPQDAKDICDRLKEIAGTGILSASGHGEPEGVAHGLRGEQIRKSGLRLAPALYFSGPCWCGVPGTWFKPESGRYVRKTVAPEKSFLLALIGSGVTGAFAGLDPDRGETNNREREDVIAGETLGAAAKNTYDDVVLSYRRSKLVLPRYVPGKPAPFRDIHDNMISGAACRALYGDPTWRPFPSTAEDPLRMKLDWTRKDLVATWKGLPTKVRGWRVIDICRGGGGWTHRLRFTFDLDAKKAAKLGTFEVVSVTKDGKALPYVYPTAALESWGDEVRVHVLIVFPRKDGDRALWGGREYAVRLRFGK